MTYAILGANGQLGQAFVRRLGHDAISLTRTQADLTKPDQVRGVLQALRPEIVINCTAYNGVDQAETDPVTPMAVNAWGVRDLARICEELGSVLIHFSTNYVFGLDKARRTPLDESSLPGPVGVYAISKLAGEYMVQTVCARHFIMRTCGLFGLVRPGSTRPSFVELMLRLAREGKRIRVVDDQICAPTRTDDLARASLDLVRTKKYGLYHLNSAGACTWHGFAEAIFQLAGFKADLHAVSTKEFGAPAERPAYSVLANAAYDRLGLPPMRHWREALAEYLTERSSPLAKGSLGGVEVTDVPLTPPAPPSQREE